jgi:hypothetical protein
MTSRKMWSTIEIKVPSEMVEYNKKGKIMIKKTLTKTFNISKFQKKPSIKLVPSDSNKVEIVNEGTDFKKEEKPIEKIEKDIIVSMEPNKKVKIKKPVVENHIVSMEPNKKVKLRVRQPKTYPIEDIIKLPENKKVRIKKL